MQSISPFVPRDSLHIDPAQNPPRDRSFRKWPILFGPRLLLSFVAFAVTLGAVEIVFRVAGIGPSTHRPSVEEAILPAGANPVKAPHGFIPYAVIRSTYDSDPRGYFGPGSIVDHIHNSLGWRDREHALTKPEGTLRILGVGDSYMWGQGVHVEDTMLSRIGRRLDDDLPDLKVETINSAILGTNTVSQLASLEDLGLSFEPDLVLLVFVPNDVEMVGGNQKSSRVDFYRGYTNIYIGSNRYLSGSRFLGWAWQKILINVQARDYIRTSVASFQPESEGWRQCRSALAGIAVLCRDRNIPLVVAIFPFLYKLDEGYPFAPIHEAVLEFCAQSAIECIDLAGAFPGHEGPDLWVHPTDQHPNEEAHALAAEALVAPVHMALRRSGRLGQRIPVP